MVDSTPSECAASEQSATEDVAETASGTSRRRPFRWIPLAGGIFTLLVVAWAALPAWSGYLGSHPIGWITLLIGAMVGAALVWWSRRQPADPLRRPSLRWVARIAAGLGVTLLIGTIWYTKPFPAESVATDALRSGDGVTIDDDWTRITMTPDRPTGTGLVFYPGARVEPRAYTRILRPLAEAGYPVVVVKQPYNLAVLGIGAAGDVIGDPDDDIDRWVIGGHSLGGAMAASWAETERDELVGLLFHAAFPANDMSDRELLVASVSGTNDGLADVDDIAQSVAELPPTTTFVAIEGAIHAHFADYGSQDGDGQPGIDRDEAQAQIVAASLGFLDEVDAAANS